MRRGGFIDQENKKGVIKIEEVGIKDGEGNFQHSLARVNINGSETAMSLGDLYDNYYSPYTDKSKDVNIEYL